MSQFLRDERFTNLTADETAIRKIQQEFVEIQNHANAQISNDPQNLAKKLILTYTIRFDGKGFHLLDFDEAMKCFVDAKRVERIFFSLQSLENAQRQIGKRAQLALDANDPANCYVLVEDDDKNWTDFAFLKIRERLCRYTNHNWIMRGWWVVAGIQLTSVLVGFLFSMWAAVVLAPRLRVDNAILFGFIAAFLIFSNAWTYGYPATLKLVNMCWPNIAFKRPSALHWLLQGFVLAATISVITILLSHLSRYLVGVFAPLLTP